MQTITSKMTSVNTSQLPAVWKKINWDWWALQRLTRKLRIVDYGCGRKATQEKVYLFLKMQKQSIGYFPYDPYWVDADTNGLAMRCLTLYNEADICVCANVLNVIDNLTTLNEIIQNIVQAKEFVVQIYEGDKSRQGKKSKEDCYQRNEPVEDYQKLIESICRMKTFRRGNIIYSHQDLIK